MSITQKLVALLEGTIKVESISGKGSSFEVCLPLFPVGGIIETQKKEENESPKSPKPTRALLIDDDRIQLELTVEMLKQLNVEAVCCEQPEELFEYLKMNRSTSC